MFEPQRIMKIQTLAALFIATLSFTTFAYAKPTTTKLPSLASQFSKPLAFDTIPAEEGDIKITPVFHGSIQIEYDGKVILVDPISAGNYRKKADYILITHPHGDHLDVAAIKKAYRKGTKSKQGTWILALISLTSQMEKEFGGYAFSLGNFAKYKLGSGSNSLEYEMIPAYNLVRGPKPDQKFHPKGEGNGYILTLGDKRIYIAGDTEATPEMKALKNIDAAFLPMNLPYTMTPQEAASAVRAFKPKVVYPYHFRYPFDKPNTNVQQFAAALRGSKSEVRVLDWYNAAPVARFVKATKQ